MTIENDERFNLAKGAPTKDLLIIIMIQARMRGWLARKRAKKVKEGFVTAGRKNILYDGKDNYENTDVLVSTYLFLCLQAFRSYRK